MRFVNGTKKHDGLCRSSGVVSTYVHAVLRGDTTVPRRLQQDLAPTALQTLRRAVTDLVHRCEVSESGSATVLPRGGGDATIVDRTDAAKLHKHLGELKRAETEARARARAQASARTSAQSSAQASAQTSAQSSARTSVQASERTSARASDVPRVRDPV